MIHDIRRLFLKRNRPRDPMHFRDRATFFKMEILNSSEVFLDRLKKILDGLRAEFAHIGANHG